MLPPAWPALSYNAQHTAQSPFVGPNNNTLAWQYAMGQMGMGAAVDANGNIYIGSQDNYFYALSPSGQLLWKYNNNYPFYRSTPAIGPDGTIYACANGVLAFNANGTLKWQVSGRQTDIIGTSPALAPDGTLVYILSQNNTLLALNTANGRVQWQYALGDTSISSPAVDSNNVVYMGTKAGVCCAIANGSLQWQYRPNIPSIYWVPAITIAPNGTIYFLVAANNGSQLLALTASGSLSWAYAGQQPAPSAGGIALAADGTLYASFYGMHAITPTGTRKWITATGNSNFIYPGPPTLGADGTVYFVTQKNLVACSPSNGAILWSLAMNNSAAPINPAIGPNGALYVGGNTNLYALQPPPPPVVTPPPTTSTAALFWANTAALQTGPLGTTGSVSNWLTTTGTAYGMATDAASGMVYWCDGNASIQQAAANANPPQPTPVITGLGFNGYGLALNLPQQKLYTANFADKCLVCIDLAAGTATPVISDLTAPVSVALDAAQNLLFWAEYNSGKIGRVGTDGTGNTYLYTTATQPQSVAVNPTAQKVYWADKVGIWQANYDGSGAIKIIALGNAGGNMNSRKIALDLTAQKIYWTDQATQLIQCANLDGTLVATVFSQTNNPTLANPTVIASPLAASGTPVVTPPPTSAATLFSANTAALQSGPLGTTGSVSNWLTTTGTAYGLATDATSGMVYWCDGNASIQRAAANANPPQPTPVITDLGFNGYGLALNLPQQKLYTANFAAKCLVCIDLAAGTATPVISDLTAPVAVALDATQNFLFWAEYNSGKIGRVGTDGTGNTYLYTTATQPQSVAVNPTAQKVYWADKVGIWQANYDGSGATKIIALGNAGGNMNSRKIAIDLTAQKIYWTDQATQQIQRANLDGTLVATVFSGLSSLTLIASPLVG